MSGRLIGVGVGPGDPELMTVKAVSAVRDAAVIAYPRASDAPSSARAVVAHLLDGQMEEEIVVPMRTERFPAAEVYDEAATRIEAHIAAGRDVAVLCEGDPFFYGSFMYLHARLAGRVPVEVIPGVSSIMAGAAATARPLAARNDVLATLPAPLPYEKLEAVLATVDCAAIIKLGRHFERVCDLLERLSLMDAAVYCERIGLPAQRLATLRDARSTAAPYFSLILVYRGAEAWVASLPRPTEGRM